MKSNLKNIFSAWPLFVLLLPVFFVLHGYIENRELVGWWDAFLLWLKYAGIAIGLTAFFWLFFRDIKKAAFFSFLILCLQFFFGSVHDFLKEYFASTFIPKYSFLLPAILLVFIIAFILLKRQAKLSAKLVYYLNLLLVLLILFDLATLPFHKKSIAAPIAITTDSLSCPGCPNPDIYLILADGYPGNTELKEMLNYDNSAFENELKEKGFYVIDSSSSNYNFTPFSIASLLNMNFLTGINGSNSDKNDMAVCHQAIANNPITKFFLARGYEFYNHSIFDFTNRPSIAKPTFILRKTSVITSQTFTHRLQKEIGFHLATTLKLNFVINYVRKQDLKNNNKISSRTYETIAAKTNKPKFVYSHLFMPHYPYYFDSSGNARPYSLLDDEHPKDTAAFISYLKHSNKQYLQLIDSIKRHSTTPPVILLTGDHGFREFPQPVDPKYYYMNLAAVHLPDNNYYSFYKGMSLVNFFRIVLNTQFKQSFPLLKDSTVLIRE